VTSRRVRPRRWHLLINFARALAKATDGRTGASIVGVRAAEIHQLADDLYDIALGKDAREAFEQSGKRGNQSDAVLWWNRSLAYWHARATGKTIDDAVAAAQRRYKRINAPSRQAVIRKAREHRDRAFRVLEKSGIDLTHLRSEIQRRSKQGNW